MLYAQVIVKKKTAAQELTYAVPVEIVPYLKVGSLVTVPLRGKSSPAVVVGLTRRVEASLKEKIRPITAISNDRYSSQQIEVIRRLADHQLASLAEIAFFALHEPGQPQSAAKASKKPIFVHGLLEQRWQVYQQMIHKYRGQRRFLILFPGRSWLEDFYHWLPPDDRSTVVLDSDQAANRRAITTASRRGQPFVILATLGRAFLPLQAGDILIIDQPDHVGSRYQQKPHLKLKTIALARHQIEQLQVVFGQELAAVADYPQLVTKRWQPLGPALQPWPLTIYGRPKLTEFLVPGLSEQILQASVANQRLLIVVLSKGWASALVCRQCQEVLCCPNCQQTIAVQTRQRLHCRYCGYKSEWPSRCPNCQSIELHPVGEGVKQVVSTLQQLLPGRHLQELSSDQPELHATSQIVVATEKIFSFPAAKFDQTIILTADRLLSGSELEGHAELLRFLYQLRSYSENVAIQTQFPDHYLWGVVARADLETFYHRELAKRRQLHLPPFGALLTLRCPGRTRETLLKQLSAINETLRQLLPTGRFGQPEIIRSGTANLQLEQTIHLPGVLPGKLRSLLAQALPVPWYLEIQASTW